MTTDNPWLAPDQRPVFDPRMQAAWAPMSTPMPGRVFDPRRRPQWFRGRVRPSHRPWSGLMLALQWLWSVLLLAAAGMLLLGPHGVLIDRPAGRPLPALPLLALAAAGVLVVLLPWLTEVLRRRADRGAARGLQVWAAGCAVLAAGAVLVQAVRTAGLRLLVGPDGVAVSWSVSLTPSAVLGGQLVALAMTAGFVVACAATAVRLNGYLRL
jgi:hypothetical protein